MIHPNVDHCGGSGRSPDVDVDDDDDELFSTASAFRTCKLNDIAMMTRTQLQIPRNMRLRFGGEVAQFNGICDAYRQLACNIPLRASRPQLVLSAALVKLF